MLDNRILLFVSLLVVPVLLGSSCQFDSTASSMDTVRETHSNAREAFIQMDEYVAPMLEDAGDRCIDEVDSQGLEGEIAMSAWSDCMENWIRFETAISSSREIFATLEDVYEDIEAGQAEITDLKFWVQQLISHADTIVRLLSEFGVDINDDYFGAIESLCELIDCRRAETE